MEKICYKLLSVLIMVSLSACVSTTKSERFKEPVNILETVSETTKSEVFQSAGLPWDILFDKNSDMSGWLYLYIEKVVSNPLTYVPYLGFILGGGDVTVFTRFYCFDSNDSFSGRAMTKQRMYKSVFSEYAAMLDSEAEMQREERVTTEMEKYSLQFDSEKYISAEWHIWLKKSQIASFQEQIFVECRKNGLSDLNEFIEININ